MDRSWYMFLFSSIISSSPCFIENSSSLLSSSSSCLSSKSRSSSYILREPTCSWSDDGLVNLSSFTERLLNSLIFAFKCITSLFNDSIWFFWANFSSVVSCNRFSLNTKSFSSWRTRTCSLFQSSRMHTTWSFIWFTLPSRIVLAFICWFNSSFAFFVFSRIKLA